MLYIRGDPDQPPFGTGRKDDRGAFAGKGLGHRLPDTGRCAGNHHDLATH